MRGSEMNSMAIIDEYEQALREAMLANDAERAR
jgi:hypothetical protein